MPAPELAEDLLLHEPGSTSVGRVFLPNVDVSVRIVSSPTVAYVKITETNAKELKMFFTTDAKQFEPSEKQMLDAMLEIWEKDVRREARNQRLRRNGLLARAESKLNARLGNVRLALPTGPQVQPVSGYQSTM